MEIEKLNKSDFVDCMKGEPTIRFTDKGVIYLNKTAVRHLGLISKTAIATVHICIDKKNPSDFAIMKDSEGWCLRKGTAGGMLFNSVNLAKHVIECTWNRKNVVHAVNACKPRSVVFRIARLPVDDDKNKNVYALLRKNG